MSRPNELSVSALSKKISERSISSTEIVQSCLARIAERDDTIGAWQHLDPDQALVMRGRFPRCRFANVVIWNHRLQTPPYRYRRVSLNRNQLRYESDGSFEIAVAHRDPGLPNWIDAAGLRTGMIFWRFLLPEEPIPPVETELLELDAAELK